MPVPLCVGAAALPEPHGSGSPSCAQLWTPPTPPQDDNDIYVDPVLCLTYESTPIPESKLPPVYVRKERRRHRTDPSGAPRGRAGVSWLVLAAGEEPPWPRLAWKREGGSVSASGSVVTAPPRSCPSPAEARSPVGRLADEGPPCSRRQEEEAAPRGARRPSALAVRPRDARHVENAAGREGAEEEHSVEAADAVCQASANVCQTHGRVGPGQPRVAHQRGLGAAAGERGAPLVHIPSPCSLRRAREPASGSR